jgi:hypothetical protein
MSNHIAVRAACRTLNIAFPGGIALEKDVRIFLAAPPESVSAAAGTGLRVAYMIYRIGRGYHLFRAERARVHSGGLMVLDTDGYAGGGPAWALITEILGECRRQSFEGIVLDIGGAPAKPLFPLAGELGAEAAKNGLRLYVPEKMAASSKDAVVLLPTALSGGTLYEHIVSALARYGVGRVALEIERVRMDFTLPATSGTGRELTPEAFSALVEQYRPRSFFSEALYAQYFTYPDKKGTHFVLYDDAASIRRKLTLAGRMGIDSVFMFYPHVRDLVGELMD